MPHSQTAGAAPEEIAAFADSIVRNKQPLVRITAQGQEGNRAWVEYDCKTPVKSASLVFTRQGGVWQNRQWEARRALTNAGKQRVQAEVPVDAVAYFFQLTDDRGLMVSSPHQPEEEFPKNQ